MKKLKNNLKVEFEDKYLGAFLGAAVGDAIGWPQEDRGMKIGEHTAPNPRFQKWHRKSGNKFASFEELIVPGSYSDDTQLLFATARSLQNKNWFSHFVRVELPTWLIYERGGGGATKRAANMWSNGNPPWKLEKQKSKDIRQYFEAGGNGVTMRVLPHVFYSVGNFDEISQQVFLNGIATHGHPRALLSAILYSKALHYQINKQDVLGYGELVDYLLEEKNEWSKIPTVNNLDDWKESANFFAQGKYMDVWEKTKLELIEGLCIIKNALSDGLMDKTRQTLTSLNCFDKNTRGAGTVACLVSIYMASKYASNPVSGLLEISFLKNTDADTNASMVGGLLGSIHGTEWILPEWYEIQDYSYISKLTSSLKNEKIEKIPVLWHRNERNEFNKKLNSIKIGDKLFLNSFEEIELVEKIKHKPLTNNIEPFTFKFMSKQGQSLFIKSINKIEYNKEVVKNDNKVKLIDNLISFNTNDLVKIVEMLPPRVTAKKTFSIILEITRDIDLIGAKTEFELKNVASKYVQKGYDLNLILKIISCIKKVK